MEILIGETIGTFIFVFFTLTIISNAVSISADRDSNSLLFVTSIGVGVSYLIPCIIFGDLTGAHFNPAVTIAVAILNMIEKDLIIYYILGELIGAIFATLVSFICCRNNLEKCNDTESRIKLFAVYSNYGNLFNNFIREVVASFIYMIILLIITFVISDISTVGTYVLIFLVIVGIGFAFDYTTLALNPFRDIFSRLIFMPMKLRDKATMLYSIVVLIAPIIGTALAVLLYKYLPWEHIISIGK